jgi:hypothetical protein
MTPMKQLIARLFAEAEQLDNPLTKAIREKLPANAKPVFLDCQLVLRSGYAAAGVLTTTPEDTLRLASIAQKPDKTVVMADHYFDYDDVATIVIGREMSSQLVQPVRNGNSPIILGH